MTGTAADVSLVWLAKDGEPFRTAWSTLSASCPEIAEATLVVPASAGPALESLPRAFPRQHIVTFDSADRLVAALDSAAGDTRSTHVLFVTCGISPEAGWTGPLLQLLDTDRSIGIVAPRLIGADGRLRAAGSVVWADGTCELLGDGSEPASRAHAFRRQVPAVPPHCLMIRADSFRAAGGFHHAYQSVEYAVADVCFSLRSRGMTAVYQPRASARVDTANGAGSESLAADRLQFRTRWERELAGFPEPAAGPSSARQRLLARDAIAGERLLVVDDRVPAPDRGSGDPRMFAMLHEMLALWPGLRITLAAMTDLDAARSAPRLLDAGIEIAYAEHWPSWFAQRAWHYGIILMSRPQPPAVEEWILSTQPQAFRIYDAEALVYRRLQRMLPLVGDTRRIEIVQQIRHSREHELQYLERADQIFCVSHDEARVARAVARPGTSVSVLPFCVDIAEAPPPFADRRDLLYFGGFMAGPGSPNEDAVLYLANEVLPLVQQRIPEIVLHVVGADPTPAILALESEHVHVVGYVADPRAWLDRARVHVVPMRFGAGVKLKLIDTMAAGLPFVTTPVGAEGLRLGGLARFTVAESARDLAELTAAMYLEPSRFTGVQQRLLRLARRHSRPRFRRELAKAMTHAGLAPPLDEAPGRTASIVR